MDPCAANWPVTGVGHEQHVVSVCSEPGFRGSSERTPGTGVERLPAVPCNSTGDAQTCRNQRSVGREEGVAAFELMLAALVVGLLVAIAMPALLRTTPRADNIDAQANLRNALIEAKAAYFDAELLVPGLAAVTSLVRCFGPCIRVENRLLFVCWTGLCE